MTALRLIIEKDGVKRELAAPFNLCAGRQELHDLIQLQLQLAREDERHTYRMVHGVAAVARRPGQQAPSRGARAGDELPGAVRDQVSELGAYTLSVRIRLEAGGAVLLRLRAVDGAGPLSSAHVEWGLAALRDAAALLGRGRPVRGAARDACPHCGSLPGADATWTRTVDEWQHACAVPVRDG